MDAGSEASEWERREHLLIETFIWLAPLTGEDGGDDTGDGGDNDGDRTVLIHIARDVLYMIKNFHFNSGDVRYSPSVDRDRYLAGCTHRWGRR